jgi:probable rRNA maturation factor
VEVVVNAGPGIDLDKKALKKACLKVLKAEATRKDAVLSLSAVNANEMRDLNRKYLEEDCATDVLAFPMQEESKQGFLLGDVVICPEFIQNEKGQYDVETGKELEFVAAHGVLHLLGYDDRDAEEWRRMESREREILGLRGVNE